MGGSLSSDLGGSGAAAHGELIEIDPEFLSCSIQSILLDGFESAGADANAHELVSLFPPQLASLQIYLLCTMSARVRLGNIHSFAVLAGSCEVALPLAHHQAAASLFHKALKGKYEGSKQYQGKGRTKSQQTRTTGAYRHRKKRPVRAEKQGLDGGGGCRHEDWRGKAQNQRPEASNFHPAN